MGKGTILYLGGFELPDKNAAAHRVLGNAKVFRALGFNVVFIDTDKLIPNGQDIQTTLKRVQDFECYSVPYPNEYCDWMRHLISIKNLKKIIVYFSDVVLAIFYNYPSVALLRSAVFCHKRGIKVIGDCTEWYSTEGANFSYKIIKGLDSFLRMRIIQKKLDGLIVISRYLENYYSNINNIVRVPPLVDIEEDKWKLKVDSESQIIASNRIELLYSGSPGKNKDPLNVIVDKMYVLGDHKRLFLKIVGITRAQFIENYPEYEYKLQKLNKNIIFVGRVTHQESLDSIKTADYFIFFRPKTRLTMAGFPTKLVESITCGVPVVTNKTSDVSDHINSGINGFLFDDRESIDLQEILNLTMPEHRKLREKIIRGQFDYHCYIDSFSAFFERLSL